MWREWIDMLVAEAGKPAAPKAIPIPLTIRLPIALLIVIWGARTDRPWTVAVAAFLAIPAMWWYSSVMLLAIIPIRRMPPTVRSRTRSPRRRPHQTPPQVPLPP